MQNVSLPECHPRPVGRGSSCRPRRASEGWFAVGFGLGSRSPLYPTRLGFSWPSSSRKNSLTHKLLWRVNSRSPAEGGCWPTRLCDGCSRPPTPTADFAGGLSGDSADSCFCWPPTSLVADRLRPLGLSDEAQGEGVSVCATALRLSKPYNRENHQHHPHHEGECPSDIRYPADEKGGKQRYDGGNLEVHGLFAFLIDKRAAPAEHGPDDEAGQEPQDAAGGGEGSPEDVLLPAVWCHGCRVAVGRVSGGLLSVWSGGLLSVCCRGVLSVWCRGLLSVWSGGLLSVWSRGLGVWLCWWFVVCGLGLCVVVGGVFVRVFGVRRVRGVVVRMVPGVVVRM